MRRTKKVNLLRDKSDDVGQLLHDQVDALDAGLLQAGDLLLDDGLEGHVGREQAHADAYGGGPADKAQGEGEEGDS